MVWLNLKFPKGNWRLYEWEHQLREQRFGSEGTWIDERFKKVGMPEPSLKREGSQIRAEKLLVFKHCGYCRHEFLCGARFEHISICPCVQSFFRQVATV